MERLNNTEKSHAILYGVQKTSQFSACYSDLPAPICEKLRHVET